MVSRGLKDEALIKSPPSDVIELLPMQTNITRAGRRPIPKGIAIAGLAVLVMVIMQVFSSQGNDYHVTQLAQAGPYALAAIGTCMIFGYGGIAFLGPSIYFAIGAYGIPMWAEVGITSVPALIITLCIALIVALVLDKLLARLESFYLAIAAVAIAFIVQDLSTGLTGLTGGVNGMAVAPLSIGSASLDSNFGQGILSWVTVAVVGIALTRLLAESFGRALAIMRSNQTVASGAAVPVPLVRATSVGIGAVLIALGGIYAGTTIGYVTPDSTGVNISLVLVVLVVAGGTRSIVGPSIAAIVYVFINAQLSDSPGIEPLVFGGSLIVFLVLPRLPWKDYGRTLSQEWHKLRKRGPNVDPERAEQ